MWELASRQGVDSGYVSRMVNLTALSPELVARILDDDLPDHVVLFDRQWIRRRSGWSMEQWGRAGQNRRSIE